MDSGKEVQCSLAFAHRPCVARLLACLACRGQRREFGRVPIVAGDLACELCDFVCQRHVDLAEHFKALCGQQTLAYNFMLCVTYVAAFETSIERFRCGFS